jgi:hypothetical protein
MDNDPQQRPSVKRFSGAGLELDQWGMERVRLSEMCLRINGYLNGCFARGARFIIWDKHRFCRAIRGAKPRKVSHIEQAMTAFRKTSSNWIFQEIYYRGPGQTRTHRRIKILPAGRGLGPTQLETTTRFLAYVTRAVKLNGSVKVDRAFLVQFWQTTGLPEEWIRIAWQRMIKLRGYRVKWRGRGNGRKAVVSMPYFPRRSSSPYGEKIKNRGARCAPDFLQGNASGPIGPTGGEPNQDGAAIAAPDGGSPTPLPPPPGAGNPPATRRTAWGPPSGAAEDRGSPRCYANGVGPPPLFLAGRWISTKRTKRKAAWLAVCRLRPLHDGFRVRWRFAHSCNFALRALRDGYREETIVAAWGDAIARSHEDACDHDLRERPDPEKPHPLREPSAAVVYAWGILRVDKRSPAERWAEIFAADPRPARAAYPNRSSRPAPKPRRSKPAPNPPPADGSGPLKGAAAVLGSEKLAEQRSIEAHLSAAGLTLAQLLKMGRPEQAAFVRAAFEAQKKRI